MPWGIGLSRKLGNIANDEVGDNIGKRIPNIGSSKGKELKYTKTLSFHWHIEDLLTHGIEGRGILRGHKFSKSQPIRL